MSGPTLANDLSPHDIRCRQAHLVARARSDGTQAAFPELATELSCREQIGDVLDHLWLQASRCWDTRRRGCAYPGRGFAACGPDGACAHEGSTPVRLRLRGRYRDSAS